MSSRVWAWWALPREPLSGLPALTPVPHTVLDPRPNLWAEAQSLLEPWANVTLTCQSRLPTLAFQLLRDGVAQDPVRLASPALEHRFPLGAVTSDTRGLYRCRSGLNSRWTGLSNLVEVTGSGEWSARGARRQWERLLEGPPFRHPAISSSSAAPDRQAGGLGQVR